ncbi:MAG: peptidase M19, partial [Chloroflexi bacterium]|nr:peptidase M19 [Chloroflexota bacterium]
LDGAFGREQSPAELDTIADLSRMPSHYAERGYAEADVKLILHGTFIRFLSEAWS